MQETIQIVIFFLAGTVIMLAFAAFVIFSALQYRKSKKIHEFEKKEMKNRYEKEALEVQVEVQEETLHFVSEEIHDNIGQLLSLAKMDLYQISKKVDVSVSLDGVSGLMNQAISGLRNISHILSQNDLNENGLVELINNQVNEINRIGKFKATFSNSLESDPELDKKSVMVIYRMIQEMISNVIKYAENKSLEFILSESANSYIVSIKDDGKGFDVEAAQRKGNGLQNLQRRAEIIDAKLKVKSTPGKGTEYTIVIKPLKDE